MITAQWRDLRTPPSVSPRSSAILANWRETKRLDRELTAERDREGKQRAEDRRADADRLERIETDIRAMRDLMLIAFQRGRTD